MTSTSQALKAAGFKAVKVTAEEYEDGVGTAVGINYVKNAGTNAAVWYTEREAMKEAGLPLPVCTSEYGWHKFGVASIEEGEQAARAMFAGHNIVVKDATLKGDSFSCRLVVRYTDIEEFVAFDDIWHAWVNS